MMVRLLLASTITIGMLASFVLFVFYLIAFWANAINIWALIGLTAATNIILWLVNPAIMDFIQAITYKIRRVTFQEFKDGHPELAAFTEGVCKKNGISIPRFRIIEDANPTAYCYGSFHQNARLVVSEGIFKYLSVEEQKAVIGHELGHIVNKDFIVMTLAVTLLQVLYETYYQFLKRHRASGGGRKNDPTPLIGAVAYILYTIGSYLVLYLSRTREYLADRFSADATGNADALSMALVKIAYGIAVEVDTDSTQRLLASTRAMGICDFKAAQSVGAIFKLAAMYDNPRAARDLTKVFLFDIFSPWAVISEIKSTHPLTGKRIQAMAEYAKENGRVSVFDFDRIISEGKGIDKGRLYSGFLFHLFIYILPALMILSGLISAFLNEGDGASFLIIAGLGFFVKGLYMFRKPGLGAEKMTVFELMQDPYANPLTGRYVEVEGDIIGKADAGSALGEDITMQDRSGCLIYLNYEGIIPVLSNIFFGLGRARKMIGIHCKAIGWFRRSSYQVIDLHTAQTPEGNINSYTRFWGIILGFLLISWGVAEVLLTRLH